jgi:hypothetical protein
MIGTLFAWAAALAFTAIGLAALALPSTSSAQYGVPSKDGHALAFVRALGGRDLVIGLLIGAFLVTGDRQALALSLAVAALAGAADFAIVSAAAGLNRSLIVHAGGTAGLLAAAWAVWAGR